ncbi:putative nucleotide-diphospho-sugar transferase [Roseovarius autotrophicus]|uniref:putative nucleotide-diphospho-sugar transferase n=1 Tax=Roseovarius autotrophicus TaxID=2824121 RepID=UPI001B360EAD|nr:putative nucleotide-diphospho-sugar transferase [Roseovarius autotrophicus]
MKFRKRVDLWFLQYLRLFRLAQASRRLKLADTFIDFPQSLPTGTLPFVIFTAADSLYLHRFLVPYCASIMAHVAAPHLHLHLYNTKDEDLELIRKTRQAFPDLTISWSLEYFYPLEWEKRAQSSERQSWKSLYICTSRFIAADEFQKRSGCNLLITDIDILFNGDVSSRFTDKIDVSMMLRLKQRNICKRTLGGVIYVSATKVGRTFLSQTALEVRRFLSAGFYWFAFDQLALYRAFKSMSKDAIRSGFSPLTDSDITFDMHRDGMILFPKGKIKNSQEFVDRVKSYIKDMERE